MLVRVSPGEAGDFEVEVVLEPSESVIASHPMQKLDQPPHVRPCDPNLPPSDAPHAGLVADPALLEALIGRLEDDAPDTGDVGLLGRYLFDCLLGREVWNRILVEADERGVKVLELALSWPSDSYDLHRLSWEAMHDGTEFLSVHPDLAVGVVRVVNDAQEANPSSHPAPAKVLFAIGSDIDDPKIRPGAEVIGLLRGVERTGSPIDSLIVDKMSITKLTEVCERFRPHIVHFVSHGRLDENGKGLIQLHPVEIGDPGYVGAGQLLRALGSGGPLPELVVLTGCESAAAGEHMDSLAAELVKGGVPTVIGMAGRISDPVCRLFGRKFGIALSTGDRLVEAVIHGRRAGLMQPQRDPADDHAWALPSIHLSPKVTSDYVPIDANATSATVRRIAAYGLWRNPVFCGRQGLGKFFERLLDDRDDLQVLVAYTDGPEALGKTRLLHEFASRALWAGHVVVMIDDDVGDPTVLPKTSVQLGGWLLNQIEETRENFGVKGVFTGSELRVELERATGERLEIDDLSEVRQVREMRRFLGACKRHKGNDEALTDTLGLALAADLSTLMDEVRALGDGAVDERSHPVLVLGGIAHWGDAADLLCHHLLGPKGIKVADLAVPIFATGNLEDPAGEILRPESERPTNKPWVRYEKLERFEDDEGALAYQWVLLHPWSSHEYGDIAYAPDRSVDPDQEWRGLFKEMFKGVPGSFNTADFYYFAHVLKTTRFFVGADDDDLLREYARNL